MQPFLHTYSHSACLVIQISLSSRSSSHSYLYKKSVHSVTLSNNLDNNIIAIYSGGGWYGVWSVCVCVGWGGRQEGVISAHYLLNQWMNFNQTGRELRELGANKFHSKYFATLFSHEFSWLNGPSQTCYHASL